MVATGLRIGCDIGGTFTDVVMVGEDGVRVAKVPSTPGDFSAAVLEGIEAVLATARARFEQVTLCVHSSTVPINTLVERKGARVGLLTTQGFRDVLEIGRASRADEYDLFQTRPAPLVPRRLRLTVRERLDPQGRVLEALDEEGVRAAAGIFAAEGVEAVAVCFLHSYANPAHELTAGKILSEALPQVSVHLSTQVNPLYREYERTSTTVVNAYIAPRVAGYVANLERELAERGLRCRLHVVQSSGGIMTSKAAREGSVRMLMAGPAAGVACASQVARRAGIDDLISLDTGGTTQLVGVVHQGRISSSISGEVDGFPIRVPMVDVRAIGAGGGSVARVDSGGMLRVGPESAGAEPGPACYARGGQEPTVTDADVVLGYLDPGAFLGGSLRLDRALAERAVYERVAAPLGINALDAAAGIIEVVTMSRLSAVRKLLIEKGLDARDFSLIAFGGAGPVHASRLLRELSLRSVVVPPHPGLASALGALTGDLRRDYGRTVGEMVDLLRMATLGELCTSLRREAETALAEEGVKAGDVEVELFADMKYAGQLHEIPVRLPPMRFVDDELPLLKRAFYEEHRRLYAYVVEDEAVTLVNLRLTAHHRMPEVRLAAPPSAGPVPSEAWKGARSILFDARLIETPVFDRARLAQGNLVHGPAVVEEYDATTVVLPGQTCRVDAAGNLIIKLAERLR